MVDVCDVPVVSKVCDVAGDAAASLASNPGKDLIDSGQWDW